MLEMFSFDAAVPLHLFEYGLKRERTEQHWHSFYEIGCCLEGRGSFFIGEETVTVEPGTLMLFPPYEPHIAMAEDEGCRFAFAYFSESLFLPEDRYLLRPFARAATWSEPEWRSHRPSPSERPDTLFAAMLAEYETKPSAYGPFLRSAMLTLAVWLYRAQEARYGRREWRERSDALERLRPALEAVAARFREPFGLREAAEALALSESRTRHLFVEGVGKRFKEYLTFVRVQEAKRLLATSGLSVTDVYLACGFQSAAPFYRSFRQLVGLNPQQYRERYMSRG
ncbi:AraC family transcriptional regulator [Cohnella rhizosphaerae]|uniref:AraC family transcriptional regulator n=1 Tax=Cohnella rhizosphaerae TaxID=1457232 RepID=A0A9X4L0A0_9BACL|nr:AraC family transcriptional regulator [Cohnella rhizosphaerae]MDG0814485.1 AraC family transcriptional regulator [Cohnella rhizosphaerae]